MRTARSCVSIETEVVTMFASNERAVTLTRALKSMELVTDQRAEFDLLMDDVETPSRTLRLFSERSSESRG